MVEVRRNREVRGGINKIFMLLVNCVLGIFIGFWEFWGLFCDFNL